MCQTVLVPQQPILQTKKLRPRERKVKPRKVVAWVSGQAPRSMLSPGRKRNLQETEPGRVHTAAPHKGTSWWPG